MTLTWPLKLPSSQGNWKFVHTTTTIHILTYSLSLCTGHWEYNGVKMVLSKVNF